MYGNSFYNPYMYSNAMNIGRTASLGKSGLFSNLFKKFNLSNFLSGANKTLNVVNQAIPIYYQIKPMVNNAKTMFKVLGAVKRTDNKNTSIKKANSNIDVNKNNNYINDGSPTFFI